MKHLFFAGVLALLPLSAAAQSIPPPYVAVADCIENFNADHIGRMYYISARNQGMDHYAADAGRAYMKWYFQNQGWGGQAANRHQLCYEFVQTLTLE